MRQGHFGSAKVFLDNKEIPYNTITYNHSGRSTASKVIVNIPDPQIQNDKIFGAKLKVFLNLGANDSVPFFRGTVFLMSPTDKNLTITAFDALNFLTGENTTTFNLTDESNFDGMTVTQFLKHYTDTYINVNRTIVGVDLLNETNPVKTLTGLRGENLKPLQIISKTLRYDDEDMDDIRAVRLTVREDANKTNYCFIKEQRKTDSGLKFTLSDGIENYKYTKVRTPNTVVGIVNDNTYVYKHNSLSTDTSSIQIKGNYDYPDAFKKEAIELIKYLENKKEMSIGVNKGYYLSIGNVISLKIKDDVNNIEDKFKIVSKKLSISKTSVKCTLGLDKTAPMITDYL
jgi:hypothetical protein